MITCGAAWRGGVVIVRSFSACKLAIFGLAATVLVAGLAAPTGARADDAAIACGQTRMPDAIAQFRSQLETWPAGSADPVSDMVTEELQASLLGQQCKDTVDQVWYLRGVDIGNRMYLVFNGNGPLAPSIRDIINEESAFTKLLAGPLPPVVKAEAERGLAFVRKTEALAEVTGCWTPNCRKWIDVGPVTLKPGVNSLRFERDNDFPHLSRLLLVRSN